jgi:hypothetical protein
MQDPKTWHAWRVVLSCGCVVGEYSTRGDARTIAEAERGKAEGYVPGIGWVPETCLPDGRQ